MLPPESVPDPLRARGLPAPLPEACPVRTLPRPYMCSFCIPLLHPSVRAGPTRGRKYLLFSHDDLACRRPSVVSLRNDGKQRGGLPAAYRASVVARLPGDVFYCLFGFRGREQEGGQSRL